MAFAKRSATAVLIVLVGLAGLAAGVVSCGGGAGRTAVVGIGNSGNRIDDEAFLVRELAEAMGQNPAIPQITDENLAEIFGAILAQATGGDPHAALIVLRTAEAQRVAAEEG